MSKISSNRSRVGVITLMILIIAMLFFVFFTVFGSSASADSGNLNSIQGYEKVLVRPGDTLDSLAFSYAEDNSHLSASEYKSQIVKLNGLSTEYLTEGVYLLLPISK